MSSDNDFSKLLEKIYIKLENFNSFEEADLFEIKNKIREISATISSTQVSENFEKLSSQLNDIEENNVSLKNTISDLITTSSSMIAKLSTTDENSIIKLQTFLTELAYQVSSIKDDLELSKNNSQKSLLDGFDNLSNSLKGFQDELGQKVKNDFEGANLAFSKIVEELTEKITEIELQFNNYNNTLVNEIVNSINGLQSDTTNINQHLENITNLQNLALTNAEFEEYQKDLELKQEESLGKIKQELSELHEKLSVEIIEILNKISIQEEIELLNSTLDENSETVNQEISTIKDYIKDFKEISVEQTSSIIKEIKSHLEKYENIDFIDSIDKIDIIYENITIINNWVSKFDSLCENVEGIKKSVSKIEDVDNKVDNINAKISVLNEWASKLDRINQEIDLLNTKVDESNEITEDEEDLANKIDIIYENLSLLNNWILKIDDINEKVNSTTSLYSEISNKVDEVSENVSNISTWGFKIEDIKEKLEELSNEFAIITSATKDDTENYIYTLLDIESDFAKLHCLLDTNTTEEDLQTIKNQFDILNDDISSISKRTNKLILTSDDSNKVFKTHIDKFQYLIQDLNTKVADFNPVKQFTLLENKTNTIKKLVASNLTSSQNLNEAFILLAEWVDSTGETFGSLKDGLDNLQAQVENVQLQNAEIQKNSQKTEVQMSDVTTKLESISQGKTELMENAVIEIANKFNEQQSTIASLEEKIDTLETTISLFDTKFKSLENKFISSVDERFDSLDSKFEGMSQKEDNSEVKTVLDFIASQVISANENSINNKVLNQKMEIMEHQLSKFEKNIAKLVSYLDED